jgi:hypothetical protein
MTKYFVIFWHTYLAALDAVHCITQACGLVAFHANNHYAGHGPGTVKFFWDTFSDQR